MQTVMITGAGRGLGLEFTRQYLKRGDRVIAGVRARPSEALVALSRAWPGQLETLVLDMQRPGDFAAQVDSLTARHACVDLLVNNAGVLNPGERFGNLQVEPFETCYRVNAVAPLLLTQALQSLLRVAQRPRVMNVSSVLGSLARVDHAGTYSYNMSKAALNMATRLIALAVQEDRIACVAVHPGWVQTDMGGDQAPLGIVESVTALVAFSDRIEIALSGGFFERDGTPMAW
jgi:NAD(P)-dependent dehydrogenase (short-subunit alcohol dehydrogenase family)